MEAGLSSRQNNGLPTEDAPARTQLPQCSPPVSAEAKESEGPLQEEGVVRGAMQTEEAF